MKNIKTRRYKILADFIKVYEFLQDNYEFSHHNGYLMPQFFEYAQTHPIFNYGHAHKIALWESANEIVGIACYEMHLGTAFLLAGKNYEHLYPELLDYAKRELVGMRDEKPFLNVWTTNGQSGVVNLLEKSKCKIIYREDIMVYDLKEKLEISSIAKGYKLSSLEENNDIKKIHTCLWKGFDHGDEPDSDYECRMQMQSGPHFRSDLSRVVIAPNESYACYAGMWYDDKNNYAYLEPLATVPEHRGLGLANVALFDAMSHAKSFGAKYCYGGPMLYYKKLGFEVVGERRLYQVF